MTWCFFSYRMHERPPEDAYAIHCYWELEHAKLIEEAEVTDASEYAGMLGQWKGAPLRDPTITRVAKLSPKLKYPARRVAIAAATMGDAQGWAVLDGPRSTWYPEAEQPEETSESVILMIHVGRQLLGLRNQPDRQKYLVSDRPRHEPQQIVAAYEKFLDEAAEPEPKRQQELLGGYSRLSHHFDAYVDALATINGTARAETVIGVYGRFLQLAKRVDASILGEVYDVLSVLGEQFENYVDALVSCGRSAEIPGLIELFAPHWDNNLGYARLGSAAFKAGQRDIAERYLLKVRDASETYYRFEEMSILAQVWYDSGDIDRARELLLACMGSLVTQIEESKHNSDRKMFAHEFQHHRSTYLRFFPESENELPKLGIPTEPLNIKEQRAN